MTANDETVNHRKKLCQELRAMHATFCDLRSKPIPEQIEWLRSLEGYNYVPALGYLLVEMANLDLVYRGWAEGVAHQFEELCTSEAARAALDAFLSQMVAELPEE